MIAKPVPILNKKRPVKLKYRIKKLEFSV